jgi:putative hydrolase of the HAD superfamily
MPEYRHLFFDLDRTLWDFDTNSRIALGEIFLHFKLVDRGISSSELFIDTYQNINEGLWAQYRSGLLNKRKLRSLRFTRSLEHFGIDDEYLGHQLGEAYIDLSPRKTALLPNTVEVLEYLNDRYELHIITNGFEEVQHIKIENSGLKPFFKKVITSEQVGARKPDPLIFHFALSEAKGNISESLMIGDDLGADILGAQNVGMDHVYFNPKNLAHSEVLHMEIADLKELKDLL